MYNIGTRDISGIDVDVSWRAPITDLFGVDRFPGEISVRSALNYMLQWESTPVPGAPIGGLQRVVGAKRSLRLHGVHDVRISQRPAEHQPQPALSARHEAPVAIRIIRRRSQSRRPRTACSGLSGGWDFGNNIRMRAGIDNLLDEWPRVVGATPDNNALITTQTGRYDPLGRSGLRRSAGGLLARVVRDQPQGTVASGARYWPPACRSACRRSCPRARVRKAPASAYCA